MVFPDFYATERVGKLLRPDVPQAIAAGQTAGLKPSTSDRQRILLLLVDAQVDFIHEDGSLSVPGAVDDTRRTIEWLFAHASEITGIAASLDTHFPFQIFYPTWWVDADGSPPRPYTQISAADVDAGRWRPTREVNWSCEYVHRLEEGSRKVLTIWPYHTMLGTPGHAITPALYEAIIFHTAARDAKPVFLTKGTIDKTEHYSILEPEVKVPDEPQGTLNMAFVDMIAGYDLVYFAGQAKSHCVLETIRSLVNHFGATRPDLVARWRLLEDCTSSVAHPEIDFEAIADRQLAEFEQQGLRRIYTRDPIG